MPWGLHRSYGSGDLPFTICSCYDRQPLLGTQVGPMGGYEEVDGTDLRTDAPEVKIEVLRLRPSPQRYASTCRTTIKCQKIV